MVDLTLPDDAPAPDAGDAAERLVARVLSWQHRHPLARRLPAADIGGLGVIALPFDAPEASGKPRPLFHQPSLVPGLSHRALVEFAQRHAVACRPGPADWPLREVERADASTEPAPETRYLLTAAITEPVKPGAQPRRLLIAPEGSAIWGPRPLSRRRVIEAVVVLLLILIAVLWGLRGRLSPGAATPPLAVMPASAPVPLIAASAPRPAPAASTPAVAPSRPAAAAPVAASSVVPAAPVPARAGAGPALAAIASAVAPGASAPKPAAVPARGPTTPVAPAASGPPAASPPASAVLPPPPKLLPMPALRGAAASAAAAAAVPSAPAPAASVVIPTGPHFALVSVPSKKRAVAEQTLARIRKVLGPAIGNLQAQIMPTPEGFVVTLWPMPTQADAEQLADVLSRRGVPMKWLEF